MQDSIKATGFTAFRRRCSRHHAGQISAWSSGGVKNSPSPVLGRKAVSLYHLNSVPAHALRTRAAHAASYPLPCNGGTPAHLLARQSRVQHAARRRRFRASRRSLAPSLPRLAFPRGFFLVIAGYMHLSYHALVAVSSGFLSKSEQICIIW